MGTDGFIVVVRLVVAGLILISVILVAVGGGYCVTGGVGGFDRTRPRCWSVSISDWNEESDTIKGQYGVFLLSLFVFFLAAANWILRMTRGNAWKMMQLASCVLIVLSCVAFGGTEIWYGTGFGTNVDSHGEVKTSTIVKTWLAAGAGFIISGLCAIADLVITMRS